MVAKALRQTLANQWGSIASRDKSSNTGLSEQQAAGKPLEVMHYNIA